MQLAPTARSAAHRWAVMRAGQWLENAMRPDGSWGYNGIVPPDSDSTAHAMLFLHAAERRVPDACYARLLGFQMDDGGFATFERRGPTDSWAISHPDVSPLVLRALLTSLPPTHQAIQRCLAYIVSPLRGHGLWQSFWWTSPLYSVLANLRILEQVEVAYDRDAVFAAVLKAPTRHDPFELALLAEILTILQPEQPWAREVARALTQYQRPGGSWEASEMLRVTDAHSAMPWLQQEHVGTVASDPNHLFTTATVVRALSVLGARS